MAETQNSGVDDISLNEILKDLENEIKPNSKSAVIDNNQNDDQTSVPTSPKQKSVKINFQPTPILLNKTQPINNSNIIFRHSSEERSSNVNYHPNNNAMTLPQFNGNGHAQTPNVLLKRNNINDKVNINNNDYDNPDEGINQFEKEAMQKELTLVRQELALLRRTQSLANHPIFSADQMNNQTSNNTMNNLDININGHTRNDAMTTSNCSNTYDNLGENNRIQSYGSTSNMVCPSPSVSIHHNQFNHVNNNNNQNNVHRNQQQNPSSNRSRFQQYQSLQRLNTAPNYSAHRENLLKLQHQTNNSANNNNNNNNNNMGPGFRYNNGSSSLRRFNQMTNGSKINKNSESYMSEIEDYNLKPIGRGITTLSDSMTSLSKASSIDTSSRCTYNEAPPTLNLLRKVKGTKNIWLKLDSSRDTCRTLLFKKEAGSFIIRIQSEYKVKLNSSIIFELVLKVFDQDQYQDNYDSFEYFSIKEFVSDSAHTGLKMIGYAMEPLFESLEQFVYRHLSEPLGLPQCLKLPALDSRPPPASSFRPPRSLSKTLSISNLFRGSSSRERHSSIDSRDGRSSSKLSRPLGYLSKKLSGSNSSLSSVRSQMVTVATYSQPSRDKLTSAALFLGKISVGRVYGQNAIRHAVDKALAFNNQPKQCDYVTLKLDSLDGITIINNEYQEFYEKFINPSDIVYCGIDPLHRGLKSEELSANGIKNSRIFGVLIQKKKVLVTEQKVYLFSEQNPDVLMENILKFIQKFMINRNHGVMR